jgi:2,5-diamino-6-(ribosylamino)-4(3H)-pyrimidinone 5'-phosphate reductase
LDRPFVYVNMAMTADGKITSATREYPRFTSSDDRLNMDRLRAEADAVLIGAGTLRADDPPLHVRDPAMAEHRRALGKDAPLLSVLVTASAAVDPAAGFFAAGPDGTRIVATVENAPADRVGNLERLAEVWRVGRDAVDLDALLACLAERGVRRLLVEGGGELNWHFIRAGLVDEIHLTVAPALLGGREAPTWIEGTGLAMEEQRRLRLLDVRRVEDELFLRYAVEPGGKTA